MGAGGGGEGGGEGKESNAAADEGKRCKKVGKNTREKKDTEMWESRLSKTQ